MKPPVSIISAAGMGIGRAIAARFARQFGPVVGCNQRLQPLPVGILAENIAAAAAFLASSEARCITGVSLPADGGQVVAPVPVDEAMLNVRPVAKLLTADKNR